MTPASGVKRLRPEGLTLATTSPPSRRHRLALRRRLIAAACAATALCMVVAPMPSGAASTEEVGTSVKRLPIYWPHRHSGRGGHAHGHDVMLVVDSARRRGYQVFAGATMKQALGVRGFDLDTLAPDRYWVRTSRESLAPSNAEEWLSAFDQATSTLYLPLSQCPAAMAPQGGPGICVGVVNLRSFDRGANPYRVMRIDYDQGESFGIATMRFYRDPAGRPKLLLGAATGPAFSQVDLGGSPTSRRREWLVPGGAKVKDPSPSNDGCTGLSNSQGTYTTPLWRSAARGAYYTMCATSRGHAMLRIPIETADGETPVGSGEPVDPDRWEVSEGRVHSGEPYIPIVADTTHDRLFMMETNRTIWVGDTARMAFVGTAGIVRVAGQALSMGVDEKSGRVYTLAPDYAQKTDAAGQSYRVQPGGLFLLDGLLTPAPQAIQLPEYALHGRARIMVDTGSADHARRIFMRRGSVYPVGDPNTQCYHYPSNAFQGDGSCLSEDHWLVISDDLPVARQPTLDDLDSLTEGVAEVPGKTDRTFAASGGSYGTRARMLGGFSAAVTRLPNETIPDLINGQMNKPQDIPGTCEGGESSNCLPSRQSNGEPAPDEVKRRKQVRLNPKCWDTDRELTAGRVQDVAVSVDSTTAAAIAAEADRQTQEDLRAAGSRCSPPSWGWVGPQDDASRAGNVAQWNFARDFPVAQCIDTQTARTATTEANGIQLDPRAAMPTTAPTPVASTAAGLVPKAAPTPVPVPAGQFASSAVCNHPKTAGEAAAQGTPLANDALGVRVGYSTSDVEITPRAGGGITVVSTAEVRDLEIGPYHIKRITARATVAAGGRKGTTTATYTRTVCGVSGPMDAVNIDDSCTADPESLAEIVDAMNAQMKKRATGITVEFTRPERTASPGGYLGLVQKDDARYYNDTLIFRDLLREVPALEVHLRRDSTEVGRIILMFAGVRAAATYATFRLPATLEDSPFLPDPAPPPPAPVPPVVPEPGPVELPKGDEFAAPPPPAAPRVGALGQGVLVRSVAEGLFTSAVWFVFGLPLYLLTRRWLAWRGLSAG